MAIINLTSESFEKTIKSDKTVLVDFWAPWCGPCKMLGPILEEVEKEISENVIVAKVNVDDEQELAQKFSVMTIPTLILFKDGEVLKKHVGLIQKDKLIELTK